MNWFDKLLLVIVLLIVFIMAICLFTETKDHYQVDLGIRYDFLLLGLDMSVGGGYLTNIQWSGKKNIRFCPYQEQYDFEFWVMPWGLITVGFRHLCVHPVYSREDQFLEYFVEPKSKTVMSVGIEW